MIEHWKEGFDSHNSSMISDHLNDSFNIINRVQDPQRFNEFNNMKFNILEVMNDPYIHKGKVERKLDIKIDQIDLSKDYISTNSMMEEISEMNEYLDQYYEGVDLDNLINSPNKTSCKIDINDKNNKSYKNYDKISYQTSSHSIITSEMNLISSSLSSNEYPMIFKCNSYINDLLYEHYMDDLVSKKPIKVFTCLDAAFLSSNKLQNKLEKVEIMKMYKVVMNHSLGDLPGTLYLHNNKLSFTPNKKEIKMLINNLIKSHYTQLNRRKLKDITKYKRNLKKGLWQREVYWDDIVSFDIIYLPPNNIMHLSSNDLSYISDPNDLVLVFEMNNTYDDQYSNRSDQSRKQSSSIHNKITRDRSMCSKTITPGVSHFQIESSINYNGNKSNQNIARSNSQDKMFINKKYSKFAKKENIQFRITRNNCDDLSKYMRWKADNQILLDKLILIDKSINQYRSLNRLRKYSEKLKFKNLIKLNDNSNILSENWSFLINLQLSSLIRNYRWNLVFSTEIHGRNFESMFIRLRRLGREYPSVLIVQTMCKQVFGVFLDENFKRKKEYYGSGQTFIFKLINDYNDKINNNGCNGSIISEDDNDLKCDFNEIKVWRASNANNYYLSFLNNSLVVGGGNNFAIRIYDGLRTADVAECETFGIERGIFDCSRVNIRYLEIYCLSNTNIRIDDGILI